MTDVSTTPAVDDFLLTSNAQGRLLVQSLAEQVDFADAIRIERGTMRIGGMTVEALVLTLTRADKPNPIRRVIDTAAILSLHPITREPLFRTPGLILSVLQPAAAAEWGP